MRFLGFKGKNKFINSNEHASYIVPGVNYYGVNNTIVYERWTPDMLGSPANFASLTVADEDAKTLLGAKLHVWMDIGPGKLSMQQVADLTLPSLQVFAETLWGIKGSKTYEQFKSRAANRNPVPGLKSINQ